MTDMDEKLQEETSAEEKEPAAETEAADEGKLKAADKKKLKKTEAELEETRKKLAAAEAAVAEEKDKYMRMFAEYENFRRRSAKEKEAVWTDAYADCVKEILPIIDNLERAAAAIPESEADTGLAKGVSMTLKAAADALNKMGITEVETKTFDPNFHNAVMHVDDEQYGEGEILDVYQKGYMKGDKVIRFAMVRVAN